MLGVRTVTPPRGAVALDALLPIDGLAPGERRGSGRERLERSARGRADPLHQNRGTLGDRIGGRVSVDHGVQRPQPGVGQGARRDGERRHVEQCGVEELTRLLDLLRYHHLPAAGSHARGVLLRCE